MITRADVIGAARVVLATGGKLPLTMHFSNPAFIDPVEAMGLRCRRKYSRGGRLYGFDAVVTAKWYEENAQ